MVTNTVTRETILTLPVVRGEVYAGGAGDVIKAAALERSAGSGRNSTGFFRGTGLSEGALASSYSIDDADLVVIGASDGDMAVAVNRVRELKGGIVYSCRGEIVEEIPMPIFGLVSDLTAPEVASRFINLEKVLKKAGWVMEDPLTSILTILFSAIPNIRLSERGYWLVKEGVPAGLMVD
jgi:adenine deaminase